MEQKVIDFHLDSENHWVADLECGHKQHVRHDPPMVERKWVLTEDGRRDRIGMVLNCIRCDELGEAVVKATIEHCIGVLNDSFKEIGLCKEGQFELALDQIKSMDIKSIYEKALAPEA